MHLLPTTLVGSYPQPEWLVVAPDCGLKYLSRRASFGKLKAMVAGAAIVRREVG